MPKVSVIVPIYGVEKYIEQCARSLFEQTLDDIEYIFVDDCTSDRSIELLNEVLTQYPSRKQQVQIVHHSQNMGLPTARRTGIKEASGEYIVNCDSDDWVDVDMYRAMYSLAKEKSADVVICDYIVSYGDDGKRRKGCLHEAKERIIKDILTMRCSWSIWNKMVKRELYSDKIIYPQNNMGEDLVLSTQLLLNADTIGYCPKQLYYYRQNPSSITGAYSKELALDRFHQYKENADTLFSIVKSMGFGDLYSECLEMVQINVKSLLYPLIHDRQYYNLWRQTYPHLDSSIWSNSELPIKDKLKYGLTFIHLYPSLQKKKELASNS